MANGERSATNWVITIGAGLIGLLIAGLGWFYVDKAEAYQKTLDRIELKVGETDKKVDKLQELISGTKESISELTIKEISNKEDIAENKADIKEIERNLR